MVNTSDSLRLIEDSVIHLSVLLVLIRFFKETMKLYCSPKDKSRVKKTKTLHSEFSRYLLNTQHIPWDSQGVQQ